MISSLLVLSSLVWGFGDDWPQWGGLRRDFQARGVTLAESWPEGGPREIWRRELGNGHATLVVGQGGLFALHGSGKRETVAAIEEATGEARWERTYGVTYEAHREEFGGPHATPLLVDDLVVTVSIDAQVHAFDRGSGELRWRRDLPAEFGVDLPQSGYAASPLRWRDTVILPGLGGRAPAALALSVETGETVWARHAFLASHASPLLVTIEGREQVVFHGIDLLVGLDPFDGDLLWRERLRTNAMDNAAFSPVWDADRRQLIVSHCYDGVGTRALRILPDGDGYEVDEAWTNRRLKVEHGNGVVCGDVFLASDGSSPAFLTGIDLGTGESLFKQRGIPKATLLVAGDKLLLLDEEGTLRLARLEVRGLRVLAEHEVLAANAWTAPTLVGKRLYLRDRASLVALELP